jgi:hypothetical protein
VCGTVAVDVQLFYIIATMHTHPVIPPQNLQRTRLVTLPCLQVSADVVCLQEVEVARCVKAGGSYLLSVCIHSLLYLLAYRELSIHLSAEMNEFAWICRQEELVTIMRVLGYTAVLQDRAKSKFTICNVTFFRASKLCCTWTDSRSRALITGFKLIPDMEFAAALATTAPAHTVTGQSANGSRTRVNGASARSPREAGMEIRAAAEPGSPRRTNGAAVSQASDATGGGGELAGAAEVFIANCHLEGHPWKAQERFNQIKGVLTRMERRQHDAGAPMDDARILVVGAYVNSLTSSARTHLFSVS